MMSWLSWGLLLLVQNISFTFVSRARNSASLGRHVVAAIFSNGIYMMSLVMALGPFNTYLTGGHGRGWQSFAILYYTLFTVAGSVLAHKFSLKTEKGKSAVGASAQYAQITNTEWETFKKIVASLAYEYTLRTKDGYQVLDAVVLEAASVVKNK
jgi:hypothetical protein